MRRGLVLGAGGQIGRAAIARLVAVGWQADACSRSPLPQDMERMARAVPVAPTRAEVIRAQPYDAVLETLAYGAGDGQDLLAAAADMGALCVISTASVYADAEGRNLESAGETGFPQFPAQIAEDQPLVQPGPGYSAGKVALVQALSRTKIPVSILRPGAVHGIGARHPREWWLVKRALDGRHQVPVADHGRSLFHTTAAEGVASLATLCLGRGLSGAFNVGDAPAPDVRAIAGAVGQAIGHRFDLVPVADLPEPLCMSAIPLGRLPCRCSFPPDGPRALAGNHPSMQRPCRTIAAGSSHRPRIGGKPSPPSPAMAMIPSTMRQRIAPCQRLLPIRLLSPTPCRHADHRRPLPLHPV